MHRKETSVVFYEDYSKDIFTTLSTEEINLFYELLEVAAQQFLGSYAKEFSIKIKKLPLQFEKIIRRLRTMIMVVNYHNNKTITSREDINLIRKVKITQNTLYFNLEKEILKPYIEHRKEFDHVFVKIDWALKSKYSKFLYRILTEHRETKYSIHYEMLLMLMNLSDPKYLAARAYNVFNRDVLKKCVDELNEWSDLRIEYYPVKNKKEKKIVEKIVFEVTTQEPKEHQKELSEQEEMDITISQLIEHKAIKEYERVAKYSHIVDKSAYINSIIRKYDRDDIAAEIRINRWIDYTKTEFRPLTDQPALLCIDPYNKKEMITIDNAFGLVDIINHKQISKKPSITLKKLNNWLEQGADIEFKALGRIYEEYLISYVNLTPSY